jgi:hypothetical protein
MSIVVALVNRSALAVWGPYDSPGRQTGAPRTSAAEGQPRRKAPLRSL